MPIWKFGEPSKPAESEHHFVQVTVAVGEWEGPGEETRREVQGQSIRLEGTVVVQSLSRVRLCDPMDRSTPGLPVLLHLLEFAQTPEGTEPRGKSSKHERS